MKGKIHREVKKIYAISFFRGFVLIEAILLPLLLHNGLTTADLFYFTAVFRFTSLIAEVPSGYFSDHWGSRNAIIFSGVLFAAASFCLFISISFWSFIIYQILSALSFAFLSGSDVAIINKIQSDEGLISGLFFYKRVGVFASAFLASALTFFGFDFIIFTQLLISLSVLILGFSINNKCTTYLEKKERLGITRTIKHLFKDRYILGLLLEGSISSGSFLTLFTFLQPLLENSDIPLSKFAIIFGVYNILLSLCIKKVSFFLKVLPYPRYLSALSHCVIGIACYFASDYAYLLLFIAIIPRSFVYFYFEDFTKKIDSKYSATGQSFFHLVTGVTVGICTCIIGVLNSYFELMNVLLGLSIFGLFIMIIILYFVKKTEANQKESSVILST
jgi:MFS family permease